MTPKHSTPRLASRLVLTALAIANLVVLLVRDHRGGNNVDDSQQRESNSPPVMSAAQTAAGDGDGCCNDFPK